MTKHWSQERSYHVLGHQPSARPFRARGNDDDWEAELGDQSHEAALQPTTHEDPSQTRNTIVFWERASSDVSLTLNNKSHLRENSPSRPRPTNLGSPKYQPDIRFSLETRPFQRETTVYKPRKPGHIPLSATSLEKGHSAFLERTKSCEGSTTLITLKGVITKSPDVKQFQI
jgi:hypothetical protein